MTDIVETPTTDEIAKHYSAAMDSVNLINGTKPENETDADWAATLQRNKAHLEIMVAKTYWTTQDLSPLNAAISKVA
jgi:RecA/RadA recombinase